MAVNHTVNPLHSVKTALKLTRQQHNLMKNHPSMRLLRALSLPKGSPPVRCGRAYGSDPTGAVSLFAKQDIVYPSNNLGDLSTTEHSMFIYRDALRCSIHSQGLNPGQYAKYSSQAYVQITNSESYPLYAGPLTPNSNTVTPHGPALFLGRLGPSDPYRGILLSLGNQLVIQVGANGSAIYPAGTKATLVIRHLNASNWSPVADATYVVAAGLGAFAYTCTDTGYYAIDFSCDLPLNTGAIPNSIVSVDVVILDPSTPAPGMVWAQRSLPHIEDVLTAVDAVRVIGVSAMYTNTSADLYKQGQITGLQVSKNIFFTAIMDQTSIQDLAKSTTLPINNGMYGFLKPTAISDLDMLPFEFATSFDYANTEFLFDIFPRTDFLALNSTVLTSQGHDGYLTFAYTVEFESFNQWATLDESNVSAQQVDVALRALAVMPQWHTNSFHIDDIWNWIKDAAGAVWGGVKEVASVAGPLLPVAAALL